MARLIGKKGIDKGVVVDVSDELVEEYTKNGYELADQPLSDTQQDDGVTLEWSAHEDYSVHGGRERHAARESGK